MLVYLHADVKISKMIDEKIFGEDLLKFLKDVLNLCNKNSDKLNYDDEKFPVFYSDGKYKKLEIKKIPAYDYFIRSTLKSEIQKLVTYSIITKYLVTPEIKKYNQKVLGDDFEKSSDFTKTLPLKFIITYLEQNQKILFEKKIFEQIKKTFFEFLDSTLEDEYIVPLFNFDSDIKQEKIFGDLKLRKISEFEFKTFTKLDEYPNLPVVYKELTDVATIKITKEDMFSGYDVAKDRFQILLEAFLLYSDGNPQFGTIHRNVNNPWIRISNNYERDVIKQKTLLFKNKNYKKILDIFNSLMQIDFSKKENKFLDIAIRRFSSALARTDPIDQVIDLTISLEALYAPGNKGEITTKLSTRLATLTAKNEEEREDYWLFTKKMYGLRSGIVHGEGMRNTEINGKKYTIDESIEKIVKLVRMSIYLFLRLASNYSGGGKIEKICDDIDKALINKKNQRFFKSKLK